MPSSRAVPRRRSRFAFRPTVRAKLAALYGGLIALTGSALLAVVYLLLKHNIDAKRGVGDAGGLVKPGLGVPQSKIDQVVDQTRYDTLHGLIVVSGLSLVAFALMALLIGWWVAGRVLAPVHQITATARDLSWRNLNERIHLRGPRDELKDLADTFDDMLTRLEAAFASQRRFIAHASHEMRTPLSIQRAAIQLGLADPSPEELTRVREHLLDANRRSERLIDGLLLLAQCDSGLPHREPVVLRDIVCDVVAEQRDFAGAARVDVQIKGAGGGGEAAAVAGDPVLLRQLVTNLISNGIRHNHPGGTVDVWADGRRVVVANSGPHVPAERVPELFEPFIRLGDRRAGTADGAGLGLSIVRSIVQAHQGAVEAEARPSGGLEVRVELPLAETPARVIGRFEVGR